MKRHCFFHGLKFAAFVALAALALGFAVMHLWNHLTPDLFGWRTISFGQALGLLVLSRILFGGFRGGHGMHWRRHLLERWEQMTPEEREKFRAGLRGGCGFSDPPGPDENQKA